MVSYLVAVGERVRTIAVGMTEGDWKIVRRRTIFKGLPQVDLLPLGPSGVNRATLVMTFTFDNVRSCYNLEMSFLVNQPPYTYR